MKPFGYPENRLAPLWREALIIALAAVGGGQAVTQPGGGRGGVAAQPAQRDDVAQQQRIGVAVLRQRQRVGRAVAGQQPVGHLLADDALVQRLVIDPCQVGHGGEAEAGGAAHPLDERRQPGLRRVLAAMKQVEDEVPGLVNEAAFAAEQLAKARSDGGRMPQ